MVAMRKAIQLFFGGAKLEYTGIPRMNSELELDGGDFLGSP
jgi:hypothetical protein